MNNMIEFINKYGFPLLLIGQIALYLALLYLRDKFAPKKTEEDLIKLSNKVTLIGVSLEQVPTRKEMHSLELKITELQGDLKRVDENLESAEKLTDLLREHTNRMDDFLKRNR